MRQILTISAILLGFVLAVPILSCYGQSPNNSTLQSFHTGTDTSPIEAVIMINEDKNKTVSFQPAVTIIHVGGEILIANNATTENSMKNGIGPDDPMVGKFFDTDIIKPGSFVEYIPENLKPGNYSFHSSTDPKVKGQLVVVP
ncbi:MAG TPA: hypothetical protein VH415_11005 [Nitrososphaeraceae archaeon]